MTTITLTLLRTLLKERPADGHKGTFGQALLIAGQWGMGGASILAARAALATGVGKVCVCLPRRNNDILQVAVPEAVLVHDPSETHFTQAVNPAPFSAVAAGPALGTRDDSAQALCSQCVLAAAKPLLLDADALNILARHPEWTKDVPDGTVITPHGGEWQRLIEAGADRKAHTGGSPETGRRGQAFDLLLARDKNRTGSEKSDAADDWRTEAHDIGAVADDHLGILHKSIEHQVKILTQDHRYGRAESYQHISPKPRGPSLAFALKPDHAAHHHSQHDPQHHRPQIQFTEKA
jgi:hypothetical protein